MADNDFQEFLSSLVQSSGAPWTSTQASNALLRAIDEWERLHDGAPTVHSNRHVARDEDGLPPSVLDLYRNIPVPENHTIEPEVSKAHSLEDIVTKLLSRQDHNIIVPTLSSILLSSKPDDAISEEIIELLGYDEMELVVDLLKERTAVGRKLSSEQSNTLTAPVHSFPQYKMAKEDGNGRRNKRRKDDLQGDGKVFLTPEEAKRNIENTLRANADRPLFTGTATEEGPVYPGVYTSSSASGGTILSWLGSKYLLPVGTTRMDHEEFEEVTIPPAQAVPPKSAERLIPVSELDNLARPCFPGYQSLNRIQSIVYPAAYTTNENLLICAPTGAGKTDVAMLAILRVLNQHVSPEALTGQNVGPGIHREDFKIIYVAPMKALASEIVRKLGKRLAWLSIKVRELTGDMQMTRTEIAETQIIVTTPEKWDVVTRKPTGEGELVSKVRLLIVDEVHLLNDERGAVIETIVARTLRQVESTQSLIRIVGLSATLPNYLDVAEFLRVSPFQGLFFFDTSFRPIPLEQHFIGIKGKTGSTLSKKNLDTVTFLKVQELVRAGHQVMVFVHARKETVKAALAIKDAATAEDTIEDFSTADHPKFEFFRREMGSSRNKEMKMLFDLGFGIHHAGMLRSDRNMMERMFEARAIKVLCCTATLAWGVNLPAHAVLIKGTQVYDSGKGAFVDLSILDVFQIFGRAGRPGMEASGEGYICTPDEKLDQYLEAIVSQHPIESQFIKGLMDSLNAEIALGTVTNVTEGVQWIGYTYLFVRMRKNPFAYGLTREEPVDDPQLGNRRHQLITSAAQKLSEAGMIRFDQSTGSLVITDLGRIAAKYYIRHTSIEIFNKEFKPIMTEADVLAMLSMSTEFDQIQVRENELDELKALMEVVPCQVKGGTDTSQGKVNILLQAHISRMPVDDFALVSDTAYAAQNGGRIIRALLEIALSRKWATVCGVLLAMSKAVEKRMWPFEHPLRQTGLSQDILYNLQRWADDLSVAELVSQSAADLGRLIHMNEYNGNLLLKAAKQFPTAAITYTLRPLGADLLQIPVMIHRAFDWSSKVHGSTEPFWIWVEDHEGKNILQLYHMAFHSTTEFLHVDFLIPIRNEVPPSVLIRFVSDIWLGAEDEIAVSLDSLNMPQPSHSHTPLLDLPLLSLSALHHAFIEQTYSSFLHIFNGIQTQAFWTLYNSSRNTLLSAPAACGKSIVGYTAIWQSIQKHPQSNVLVVLPRKRSAKECAAFLKTFVNGLGIHVDFVADSHHLVNLSKKGIHVTTSACLFAAVSRGIPRMISSLGLVLLDDLELLDDEYELAISLLLHASQEFSVRIIGMSAALSDSSDLAEWLHVPPEALYSFRPADRDQALITLTQTFTIPHSAALLKAMSKPVHDAIRASPLNETAVVFVPTRFQCRMVATELITQCAIEMDVRGFLGGNLTAEEMDSHLAPLKDRSMYDALTHGIGFFHEGMEASDRLLVLELYTDGFIRVLLTPRESCWSLPVRAGAVIVMGTQYTYASPDGGERQVKDYTLQELVRMQSLAVRHGRQGKFYLMCQAEERDTFLRFLDDGLPLESSLADSDKITVWLREQRTTHSIQTKQDIMDVLSFTYLAKRIATNPTYYNTQPGGTNEALSRIADKLWEDTPEHPVE